MDEWIHRDSDGKGEVDKIDLNFKFSAAFFQIYSCLQWR